MIITRLFGGAGNQLFQYATGRALADRLCVPLALDRRYVGDAMERGDCFEHFQNARFEEAPCLPPSKMDGAVRYGLWRLLGRSPSLHRERGLGFDPTFFDLPDDSYLHGYWQSEKYFGPDPARLRADLTMTTPLDVANAAVADRIGKTAMPVSVHVRRGDYMSSGAYAACTADYYRIAVARLQGRSDTPLTAFVFSNDPAWAADNLDLGIERVVVDVNDEHAGHFDMHLMSLCTHHVIANSTFSWWGAWLNPDPDKTVIAPKNWFADPRLANPDLIPESWITL